MIVYAVLEDRYFSNIGHQRVAIESDSRSLHLIDDGMSDVSAKLPLPARTKVTRLPNAAICGNPCRECMKVPRAAGHV